MWSIECILVQSCSFILVLFLFSTVHVLSLTIYYSWDRLGQLGRARGLWFGRHHYTTGGPDSNALRCTTAPNSTSRYNPDNDLCYTTSQKSNPNYDSIAFYNQLHRDLRHSFSLVVHYKPKGLLISNVDILEYLHIQKANTVVNGVARWAFAVQCVF